MNCSEFEIVRFEHLNVFMNKSEVEVRAKKIYDNTFIGKFAVSEAKVRRINSGYKEIWALRIPVSMKYSLKEYYKLSAQKCGYIQ